MIVTYLVKNLILLIKFYYTNLAYNNNDKSNGV